VIEILRSLQGYHIVGLLDAQPELKGKSVLGVEVLGDDSMMAELKQRGVSHAFIGVGTVGDARARRELYEKVLGAGFEIVAAIHAAAVVTSSAQIGDGPTIMAGAIVNADAVIGKNVIVNTGAIVEHDCVIGDHTHVATGARLAGGVQVGPGAHIGIGAVVRQEITIGEGAIVGAGAVVVKNVPAGRTVMGVPAK
jgi:UDP-perosamine 4-acetyltransferase